MVKASEATSRHKSPRRGKPLASTRATATRMSQSLFQFGASRLTFDVGAKTFANETAKTRVRQRVFERANFGHNCFRALLVRCEVKSANDQALIDLTSDTIASQQTLRRF